MADVLEQSTPKFRSPYMSSETAAYLADAFEPEAEAEIVEEIEACDEELGEPSVVEEEISADERSPVDEQSPVQFPAPQALAGGQRAGRRLRSMPFPGVVLAALSARRHVVCAFYPVRLCCSAPL